jgi:NitT/TauT family transport system substrate-binding protein
MGRGTFARCGAVAVAAALLAGCGSSGGGGGGGSSEAGKPVTLKVGVLPVTDVAPLYIGRQQGFFAQQKLTVKPQVMQGGAEARPRSSAATSTSASRRWSR